ncbi:MAG: YlxM family DNA-binding protein [Selenomonadaceae bacterium]
MLEKLLQMSALFDFYGALLTEKQQRCLEMHLFEDFSLSEIGSELGISRQAVYDIIHRSEQSLRDYENKLGLVARHESERDELQAVVHMMQKLKREDNSSDIDDLIKRLANLIGKVRGA